MGPSHRPILRAPLLPLALVLGVACGGGEREPARAGPGEAGEAPAERSGSTGEGTPFSYVFRCGDDFAVAARAQGDSVSLVLPGRDVVLARVRSASGARYEGEGIVFHERGSEARVELTDTVFTGCTSAVATDPWHEARLRGVAARALGQEPGWIAEVDPDRFLSLELDYGERRILLPAPTTTRAASDTGEPNRSRADTLVYRSRTDVHDATLRFAVESCADPMSGQRSSHTVRLEIDGDVYRGCGRILLEEGGTS